MFQKIQGQFSFHGNGMIMDKYLLGNASFGGSCCIWAT